MEINRVLGNVLPVVANEDLVEGSFVCLVNHTAYDYDFGSLLDLPAVKVPTTADEAKGARFCVTFAVDNRTPPIYQPMPSRTWSTRDGFGTSANTPFSATVYTTYPGYQHGKTIPSGVGCLAYGAGTFTIPSGQYIYSSGIILKGARVSVSYTAPNRGKLQAETTYDASVVVGFVEKYDSTTGDLTVTTGAF